MMRLELLPPERLSEEQKGLYDRLLHATETSLKGFVSKRADGALAGPFNAMLHFPQFGEAAWAYAEALTAHTTLPKPVHEVVILVTGARFHSRYEIYAHERVGAAAGLSEAKIATIAAGQRPADLSAEEAIGYDVAAVLSGGGQLPGTTYRAAVSAFGEAGMAEIAYLVGLYCQVSVLLNAYDVSVPGQEEGLPEG